MSERVHLSVCLAAALPVQERGICWPTSAKPASGKVASKTLLSHRLNQEEGG